MIKLTLTQRIWLSFIILIIIVGVIVGLVYPISLQRALRDETFTIIRQEQQNVLQQADNFSLPDSDTSFIDSRQAERLVNNFLIVNGYGLPEGDPVPKKVLGRMAKHANEQKGELGQYNLDYKGKTLFYVVRKLDAKPNTAFLISYMWDTYRNTMMKRLWARLIYVLVLAAILGLAIAAWMAHYLKRPLDVLGSRFEEISRMNWKKPFEWKSGDEFERLSAQFEKMRRNLLQYDESQQQFLQQASHELKTPIMVIQSYAQSAKDGIYPQGGLDDTMDVIIEEAEQMENRVKKLLYFTRVASLKDERPNLTKVQFGEIAEKMKDRLAYQRPGIAIDIKGENTEMIVDREQWQIVLENLIENALRYAESNIWLIARDDKGSSQMIVKNDGSHIEESEIETLFQPFNKGEKGQFGLGLAIVQRIVDKHHGTIKVKNDEDGVAFIIRLPRHFSEER
ncbi:two-component system sensor histidine kinase CssS [Scopulibacillus darangshiensis]|uniref:histidine kinase n=1 Tax=Scopulibacillus darangshiensis TaxID=442528 RepID=A0A4R2P5A7_9BACL|nr:HAMP domain-containing sensor histidine kinase [Scopulibacillus darangshiensis]TCP29284.1 two-component system sensor histidine kinase CssS [Scopulibacillus darangshiensis]